ncbi:hypothetical protein B0H17DRAFT_1127306 [Mycena rosella]|uniref:Secreted protein n=1 Tax=Mycena rosella TaxID=1033263 RepID=A0AAD7GRK0_MYCRO|nr:hypothetical protein B0H17DRAFT_1127306 [Mycena rosella]
MTRPSFAFARSHLILPSLLALQLYVSSTQAFHCNDGNDDFDCNHANEDPATRRRNLIIGVSVIAGFAPLPGQPPGPPVHGYELRPRSTRLTIIRCWRWTYHIRMSLFSLVHLGTEGETQDQPTPRARQFRSV